MTEDKGERSTSKHARKHSILYQVPIRDEVILNRDLKRTNNVEGRLKETENSITSFTASNEHILSWYYAQDPLDEARILTTVLAGYSQNQELMRSHYKRILYKESLYETAAASIVTNVFIEEAPKDQTRLSFIYNLIRGTETQASDQQRNITPKDIVEHFLTKNTGNPSLQDLQLLVVAAEMFHKAARCRLDALFKDDVTDEELLPIIRNQQLAHDIYTLVLKQTLATDIQNQELQLLGLNALCAYESINYASRLTSHRSFEDTRITRKRLIHNLIVGIEKVFFSPINPLKEQRVDPQIRGQLHETIWFLDAIVYLTLLNNASTKVIPSVGSEDRPIIGYPHFNRGFDVRISDTTLGVIKLIQLKSIPQPRFQKKYHPNINTVYEKNFLDINPGRLRNKLAAYKKYIESDFNKNGNNEILKYLLPSVPETLDFATKAPDPEIIAFIEKVQEGKTLDALATRGVTNRATRRLAKKRYEKLKKKGYLK